MAWNTSPSWIVHIYQAKQSKIFELKILWLRSYTGQPRKTDELWRRQPRQGGTVNLVSVVLMKQLLGATGNLLPVRVLVKPASSAKARSFPPRRGGTVNLACMVFMNNFRVPLATCCQCECLLNFRRFNRSIRTTNGKPCSPSMSGEIKFPALYPMAAKRLSSMIVMAGRPCTFPLKAWSPRRSMMAVSGPAPG